jgi:hypothetical protein
LRGSLSCHRGLAADDTRQAVNRKVVNREIQSQRWKSIDDHPHQEAAVSSNTSLKSVAGDGPILLSNKDFQAVSIRRP